MDLYLFEILISLLYLIFGVRLSSLGQRTGGGPERLLGIHYLCSGVSYACFEISVVVESGAVWIEFIGRALYSVGLVPLLLFTRNVFRRDVRWATWLVWGMSTCLFVGVTFSALGGDFEGVTISNPWFWPDWVGYTVPYAWIGMEAALAYSAANKRARIGFAEPVLANRFLLWALFGLLTTMSSIALIPLYIEVEATGVWPAWGDYFVGGLEFSGMTALWLAFFPPKAYLRLIHRSDPVPDAGSATA